VRTAAKSLIVLVIVALVAIAQAQIATVTSDGPFQLRGANVAPGQGVPSWPVLPGNTIKAGTMPATITFPDGSTIILAPGASATVNLEGQTPVFQLENGAAHYNLKDLKSVKLLEAKKTVTPTGLVGDLALGGNTPPAGWWTAGHTTGVVIGAIGATALGVGLGKGIGHGNGPPVSPTVCNNGNGNGNGQPACP
jgi:hypothetical protein